MEHNDVLITGAGPSGLILALSLMKMGVRPRIIDKNSGPGQQSRALGVQARTLEFYRQLGFADKVVDDGIKIESIRMWLKGELVGEAVVKDFGANLSPYPFILSYPQDVHEKLLVELLKEAGLEVEWETELTHFEQIGYEIDATIRKAGGTDEKVSAGYLCGCDGAHSIVRDGLNLEFGGGTYDNTYYVADVNASGPTAQPTSFNFCIQENGFLLVIPIRDSGSHRLIGVMPNSVEAEHEATFDDVRPLVSELAGLQIEKVNWFSTYRIHHRVTEHFKVGSVFLCGDAGHIHSPVGGQGMNTGIGDAVNLAWKLAAVIQGRANNSILDTYEPERITFAKALLSTTDKVFQLMSGSNIGNQIFRDQIFPHLFPYAMGFPNIRTAAFKLVSQINIDYHHSDLSEGQAGNIRGGDRLPWVKIDDNSDNFVPMKNLNWQVHVYGEADHELKEMTVKSNISLYEFDWTEETQESGLLRDAMYLVRPDGYVALAHSSQNVERLTEFLAKFNIVSGDDPSAHPADTPPSTGSGMSQPEEQLVGARG